MTPEAPSPLGVVHYGLGPIGLEIARLVGQRSGVHSVAAIDIRPELLGRDLAELLNPGDRPSGVVVKRAADGLQAPGAHVVAHCTSSSLERVLPQLQECIEAGLSVVSTCEELSYPWHRSPELARRLDALARDNGVTVLGTGINPGFAMDYLPVALSGASRRVDHVRVHRVQDAATRRLPLQQKVGAGLDPAAFEERVRAGTVRHVGLSESAQALAAAFGWTLTGLRESIEPILAERRTASGLGDIGPGRVAGVRQVATGVVGDREVLTLILEMAIGLPEPRDEVALTGDPDLRMIIPGGLHGDVATAAMVVNSMPRILRSTPGLIVMADLPPPHP
jgi:2,4-diaminopentanoate dehydrogenase